MKQQETRDAIISTAIDQFWQKSYHGVNMNALSREIGINKATIYQHFASKEELAVAAVHRSSQLSGEYAYVSTFAVTADPKERLEGIYQKVYDLQKSLCDQEGSCRGCPFVSLGMEMATSSHKIRDAVAGFMASLRPYYGRIIDGYWKTSPPKVPVDKEALISALVANMNGCLVAAKLENRPAAVLDGQASALRILGM